MIQKHKWPVLEYDDSREVMVKPNRNEGYRFPPRAVLFFHRQGVEEFAGQTPCMRQTTLATPVRNWGSLKPLQGRSPSTVCR